MARLRTYYEGEEGTTFDPDAKLTWSRWAGHTPRELAVTQPDFLDWCIVTSREQKTSPQLAEFAEWAETARAKGEIPGSGGSTGSTQLPLRPRLKAQAKAVVKTEVAAPTGPPPPQWDGRAETLESYLRQAKAYADANTSSSSSAPMETRDKRKDPEGVDDPETPDQK
jgi:hypothetical protein